MTNADRIALHERMVRLEERERVLALLEEEANRYEGMATRWEAEYGLDSRSARVWRMYVRRLRDLCERFKREEHWTTKEGA